MLATRVPRSRKSTLNIMKERPAARDSDGRLAGFASIPGECSERTFLFRIAHNRAIDGLARRRVIKTANKDEFEIPDPRPDPETCLFFIGKVITLTLEGIQYSDLAQILGVSESNVGVRLNRARQCYAGYWRTSDECEY